MMDEHASTDAEPGWTGAAASMAGLLRIAMGWVFFWPFLDKTFGLGYATASGSGWVDGGHPTHGYLASRSGWFAGLFNNLADSAIVEWLFMLGLLGIGLALLAGIGMKIACSSGSVLLFLMYLAELPFSKDAGNNNPFLDDHIVYILALLLLLFMHAGRHLGLGRWWTGQGFVQKNRWLE